MSPGHGTRLGSVELLRLIAGLAVLWLHLTMCVRTPFLRASGSLGWIGVEIFFVVSGFVMPYAMYRMAYAFPTDMPRFIARRVVRLDPPYLVASFGAAALAVLAAHFRDGTEASDISWAATLAHFGYLNGILGLPWYDPVCWTLGIEFQFYVVAAILFPLFVRRTRWFVPAVAVVLLGSVGAVRLGLVDRAVTHQPWLLPWSPFFVMGISAFRRHVSLAHRAEFLLVQVLAAGAGCLIGARAAVVASALSAALIAFGTVRLPTIASAFAGITYSLYLVHVPIGMRAVNVAGRIAHASLGDSVAGDVAALTVGLVVSIGTAVVFWWLVERPALLWASRITPRRKGHG